MLLVVILIFPKLILITLMRVFIFFIFQAADLAATKYRATMAASLMLGSGKNVWQAEIGAFVLFGTSMKFAL